MRGELVNKPRLALAAVVMALAGIAALPAFAAGATTLTPASHDFGSVAVNGAGGAFGFVLTTTCTPSSDPSVCADDAPFDPVITVGGEFFQTNDCPLEMPGDTLAGTSCRISVSFAPVDSGALTGTLFTGPPGTPSASLKGIGGSARSFKATVRRKCSRKHGRKAQRRCRRRLNKGRPSGS